MAMAPGRSRQLDTLVIGGGAIGTTIALELARRGVEVTLLERHPDHSAGASAGTAGLICPSHAETIASPEALRDGLRFMFDPAGPFALRANPKLAGWIARFTAAALAPGRAERASTLLRALSVRGLEGHRRLGRELPTGYEQRGILNVFASERDLAHGRSHADGQRAQGLVIDDLDAAQVAELEPTVRGVAGGTLAREEGHIDSLQFTRATADGASAAGAQVSTGVEALALRERTHAIEITTSCGPLHAQRVVICAGMASSRLGRSLGLALPLAGAKGYHVEVQGGTLPSRPVYLHGTRVVATPLGERLRFAGTLELGSDPEAIDRRRADAALEAGRRSLSGLDDARVTGIWRGLRPCLPDGLPAIGRTRASERVLVATGHQMLGITLAPITAEIIAALVAGEDTGHDLTLLDPDRFPTLRARVGR